MIALLALCSFIVSPAVERLILSVDPALIKAVVANESAFKSNATSPTGAAGPMQLEPATSRELGVCAPYDPSQNIIGGIRYLKAKLDDNHGNIPLSLAAYNAGQGAVNRYHGIPPYPETRAYVANVVRDYLRYRGERPTHPTAPAPNRTSPTPLPEWALGSWAKSVNLHGHN